MNFLFVVALYAGANDYAKNEFKQYARRMFRTKIIEYLEKRYQFFSLQRRPDRSADLHSIINSHFRNIIGRTFRPYSDIEIIYLSCETKEKYQEENLALLSQLSDDFIIRDYKLGTDPRDAINRFTDVYKEAGEVTTGRRRNTFTLADFADETILIGGYRKEKDQLQWILNNKKYNVRENAARSGNVGRIRETAISARLLLLYDISTYDKSDYKAYIISSPRTVKAVTMEKLGYKEPSGQYLLYDLLMEVPFEQVEINHMIDYARIEEMERRRSEGTITEGWERKWYGTPVYYKGSEMMRILAEYVATEPIAQEPVPQFQDKENEPEPTAIKKSAAVAQVATELELPMAAEPPEASNTKTTEIPQVQGIWQAFKSVQFRKRYEKRLIDGGERKAQAVFKMQHFYNKVKDADQGGIFHRRLNDCMTFDEMHTILTDLFTAWRNNLKYPWVRDLFFNYLVYLRELYLANGNLDDSKENNLTKSSKIQLTYRNGTVEQLNPLAALMKVVLVVGPDKVSEMNLRIQDDKLLMKYKPFNDKYYKQIKENWWILTKGTPKAKYQTLYSILQRYSSLGIKIKLI